MQPLAHTTRQPAQHWQFGNMVGHDPDQRAGMTHCLKQRKGAAAQSFGLMDPSWMQGKGIGRDHPLA
ncbi:hypothetical protein GCM10010873_25490 [Cypionkella aquatica]|uniref:Uncharacterized protein n=1 Tax=Cypionkella aquatica TaxID=1756042 RepID=A0AA37X2I0_9RHOB|nr:hypothetical protein GCM10010873_25490 [Cypionkella aquatica]